MASPGYGWRQPSGWSMPWRPVQIVEPTWLGDGCSGPGKSLRFQWSRSRSPSMSLWRAIVRCVRGRRVPKVALGGVVVGQQRWGVNLVSLIVTLREEGRLPIRTIQWYLKMVHQLHLSVGGIVQVIHGAAQQAQLAVAEVLERIRASPVVQADETGWRQDGANGYVWTFSTPTERYFLRRGRDKGVVDEVLDESFGGGVGQRFLRRL